jgi:hypothetical protein
MRNKLMFLWGAAIGFVLGTRAGREQYERMRKAGEGVMKSPTVTEAVGSMRVQAAELAKRTKETATGKINEKRAERREHAAADAAGVGHDERHSRFVDHVPGHLGHHSHDGS